MPRNRYDEASRSARARNLAAGASTALRQAHESARRAYERGATVSRAYNWLHLFNHPSPTSSARRFERWNREVGTRIGVAAASAADIGPQLLSAMQGGMLLVSDEGTPHSPAPSGRDDGGGQQGRGAMPQYEGDGFRNGAEPDAEPGNETEAGPAEPDAPTPAPNLPYGNSELFWDFVL